MRYIPALIIGLAIVVSGLQPASAQPLRKFMKNVFGGGANPTNNSVNSDEQRQRSQQLQYQNRSIGNTGRGRTPTPAVRPATQPNATDRADYQPSAPPATGSSSSDGAGLQLGARLEAVDNGSGLIIRQVSRGSYADRAGFKSGDVITKFADMEVDSVAALDGIVSVLEPGDQVEVEFTRRGRKDKALVAFGNSNATQIRANTTDTTDTTGNNGGYSPPQSNRLSAPGWAPGRQAGDSVSVLNDLHAQSSPTTQGQANPAQRQLQQQVDELKTIIRRQETVIESLQQKLNQAQHSSRSRGNYTPRGR